MDREWKLALPAPVDRLLRRLCDAGYRAYAVGGCVRDSLLGKVPDDWDVTTDALPEQIHQALTGMTVLDTGLKHGTVTAVTENMRVEITTFRVDGDYSDHRRPDSVRFTRNLREDLARRDLTVNAMAYRPDEGLQDPFGGRDDLKNGLLRAVGDPAARFEEDALRILRTLRFASRLGFRVEETTAAALSEKRELLRAVAPERIQDELCKLLTGRDAARVLREKREVFAVVLPELAPMFDFDQQNPHHIYDVWEHTLHAVDACEPELLLRLTMLLHDCAKPLTFTVDFRGDGHFYGHAALSARLTRQALERLRFDNETVFRVTRLVSLHDSDVLNTEKSLLRWLRKIGEEDLRLLLKIKMADNLAQSPHYSRMEALRETQRALETLVFREPCFDRSRLAVKGGDLTALGLRGAEIGAALDGMVEAVIAGTLPNEKEALLDWCRREAPPRLK